MKPGIGFSPAYQTPEQNFAEIQRDHDAAAVTLRLVFGDEYTMLGSEEARKIRSEFLTKLHREGWTVTVYRDYVGGRGRLEAHARRLP